MARKLRKFTSRLAGQKGQLILKGVAFEKAPYGKHIIVSDIEHPAIKESAAWLKTQGFEVDYAPVDARGFVKVDALASFSPSGYDLGLCHGRQYQIEFDPAHP